MPSKRYRLVKLIAPYFVVCYDKVQAIDKYIMKTPRPMILAAKKRFGNRVLKGIEIGVEKADNTLSILQELSIGQLFLIDPYVPYEDALGTADYSKDFDIAHNKLLAYPQVVWLKKISEDAVKDIQNKVDFVYIDGNHSYEFVKKDIKLYYQLLKKSGMIGGHDYTPFYEDIIKAVNEYSEENNLELTTSFPDWWFLNE